MQFQRCFIPFLLFITIHFCKSDALFEWLFGDEQNVASSSVAEEKKIRFEVLSSDEKFLDFAKTLTDLSPLDACYNVVIYTLKKKCGELSEEELGKLSVQLLNCQSEAEDRPVFKCTNAMSLADCTKEMDGTTWNSYQIVGNRARAMCYATQQAQFRRLTELTVNTLLGTTADQLKSMEVLKDGQTQLHDLTSETIRKLFDAHKDLLTSQNAMKKVHEGMAGMISSNVEGIMKEKAMIAAGNQELAKLTENIKEKLDSTNQRMVEQEKVENTMLQNILKDLKMIEQNTESYIEKYDSSLGNLLSKYEELDSQYSDLAVSLSRMNETVTYVMASVEALKTQLDDRVQWITELLGGTDMKLKTVTCCLLHLAYFFMLVMTATFLQVSLAVRLFMMVIIVGNVSAELHYDHSMDFAGMTVLLLSVSFGFKFLNRHCPRVVGAISYINPTKARESGNLSSEEYRTLLDLISKLSASVNNNRPPSPRNNGSVVHDTSFRPVTPPRGLSLRQDRDITLNDTLTELSPRRARASESSSRASTPIGGRESRSSSLAPSTRCQATTIAGSQCRLPISQGSPFCRRHNFMS